MRKILLAGAMVAGAVLPAAAQTTIVTEYYVIQDSATKRCTIVNERPTSSTSVVLDLGIFRTRTDAELGARKSKVCVYE